MEMNVKIIAHRGFWVSDKEKNSSIAFSRAIDNGFGIETDFRDYCGELIISHDIPLSCESKAKVFFEKLIGKDCGPIAVNIKSDGLLSLLDSCVDISLLDRLFVFDMSIPDTFQYLESKFSTFIRVSEFESPNLLMLDKADGVWLDSFYSDWFDYSIISGFIDIGLKVCIVSPELHGREYKQLWFKIKSWNLGDDVYLCTDLPHLAKEFF